MSVFVDVQSPAGKILTGMRASCGAGPGDSGAGKYLEAPEPMAEVVSSAFSRESMASMLASCVGGTCWNII